MYLVSSSALRLDISASAGKQIYVNKEKSISWEKCRISDKHDSVVQKGHFIHSCYCTRCPTINWYIKNFTFIDTYLKLDVILYHGTNSSDSMIKFREIKIITHLYRKIRYRNDFLLNIRFEQVSRYLYPNAYNSLFPRTLCISSSVLIIISGSLYETYYTKISRLRIFLQIYCSMNYQLQK